MREAAGEGARRAVLEYVLGVLSLALGANANASELVVALTTDMRSLVPGVNRDAATDGVMRHVVEGLVAPDDRGEIKPLLAKRVTVSDDGLIYNFEIREDVVFHNGRTMTAKDVKWNLSRYLTPDVNWGCLPDFDGSKSLKIEDVTIEGDRTVKVRVNRPSGIFLASLARPECGFTAIVSPDSVDATGEFVKPIGTGPFTFSEWVKGQHVILQRNPLYVSPANEGKPDGLVGSKKPLVDRLKFLVVPDQSSVKAGLQSGVLHGADIPAEIIPDLKDGDTKVIVEMNSGKNLIIFQTKSGPLSNAHLRRALAASIDLDALVEGASAGTGKANPSLVPLGTVFYSDVQAERPNSGPDFVKLELEKAGYNGEVIKLIANKRAELPSYPVALIAQSMMQSVGINVEIEVLDFATQTDRRRSGNYEMMSHSIGARTDPALAYAFLVGDKSKDPSKM